VAGVDVASSLEQIALKLLGPGAAAFAGVEAFGLDVGAAELGAGAIALFLVRKVFNFVKWNTTRKDPPPEPAVSLPPELLQQVRENERLLKELIRKLDGRARMPARRRGVARASA